MMRTTTVNRQTARAHHRHRQHPLLISGSLGLLLLTGCSGGDTSQGPQTLKADAVCDGAFQGDAARALESASGATAFREVDADYLSTTYTQLTKDLVGKTTASDSDLGKNLCEFRAASKASAAPAELNFALVLRDIGNGSDPVAQSSAKETAYTFAAHASASDERAWLTFPCTPTSDTAVQQGYVTTTLRADPFRSGDPGMRRADNMRMAYSASVKLANKLDCFKESKLPRSLGTLTARPAT
jgi:hypothetical protein